MISTSLETLAGVLNGAVLDKKGREPGIVIDSVSTDTRTIGAGSLFIALEGERFDAHDFCQQAMDNGAAALLVHRPLPVVLPQIIVSDTRIALGELASWVFGQCAPRTMAITGSCGKTTVKEMVYAILTQKGNVLATAGNFNNDIGVPLTLLRAEPDVDYAVIELGANHAGEIAYTTDLVRPTVALVNNVAAAHLEGFGSLEGVMRAKGEIYQGLNAGDCAIVNLDSHGGELWETTLADKRLVTFSVEDNNADYYATDISLDEQGYAGFTINSPEGRMPVRLSVVGLHNISNALAACALCGQFGASLEEEAAGLANVVNAKGRVEVDQLADGLTLIDDSYNASVPAMRAAVDLLASYKGIRWLILGYMAELGTESLELHRQLGEYAARFGFEHILTYGDDTKIISDICHGIHFTNHDKLVEYIEQQLQKAPNQTHTVLIKGANSARMSIVAEALKEKHK